FDTDFGGDADDLGALAMLHGFAEAGEIDLLGIMVWKTEASVIPAIDAVNRYYGHPDIPIGIRKENEWVSETEYSKAIAESLPHLFTNADVPEVISLYRKILSENKNRSITLITVGPLLNIKMLLESDPDEYSSLTGKELFHKKVKEMIVMGGHFPEGKEEWNFWGNMPGVTRAVFENVKVPVVFLGYEIGVVIKTGEVFNALNPLHPLYLGFRYFSEHAPWMNENYRGLILDNASYDQTAVLYAVKGGLKDWWEKVQGGFCEVDENGDNRWVKGKKTNHSYLELTADPEVMAAIIEAYMLYDLTE
ncbi:MAG: nucleoside hydrolase, partial [Bacteroidales bacterium]|nr:nucleoside hydrolase [Bacteroidales bacterium]